MASLRFKSSGVEAFSVELKNQVSGHKPLRVIMIYKRTMSSKRIVNTIDSIDDEVCDDLYCPVDGPHVKRVCLHVKQIDLTQDDSDDEHAVSQESGTSSASHSYVTAPVLRTSTPVHAAHTVHTVHAGRDVHPCPREWQAAFDACNVDAMSYVVAEMRFTGARQNDMHHAERLLHELCAFTEACSDGKMLRAIAAVRAMHALGVMADQHQDGQDH